MPKDCSYCKEPASFVLIYERSIIPVCNEHLAWYTQFFNKNYKPYIVPVEYLNETYFFPVPQVHYGNGEINIFGKTKEEFKQWMEETQKLVPDMNIK